MRRPIVIAALASLVFIFSAGLYWWHFYPDARRVYSATIDAPLANQDILYASADGYDIRDYLLVAEVDSTFVDKYARSPTFYKDCRDERCAAGPVKMKDLPVMEGVSASMIKDQALSQRVAAWLNEESTCRSKPIGDSQSVRYGWSVVCLSADLTTVVFREMWL